MVKKVWSGILPISILVALILGILVLGRLGNSKDKLVLKHGEETIATTLEPGKRMIQISYSVDGRMYTEGVVKPFSYLQPGEQYQMTYLSEDPKAIVVFFTKPILSGDYAETECVTIGKLFSVVNFEYRIEGILHKRETLFNHHTLRKEDYIVKYRKSNPEIGYLMRK